METVLVCRRRSVLPLARAALGSDRMPQDSELFAGRTAVVTGGARGLGFAMAEALAAHGADVALLDRLETVEASAGRLVDSSGVRAVGVRVDVTDQDSVNRAFAAVGDQLGVPTVLINAAGIALGGKAINTRVAEWKQVLDVNLTGTFLTCQAFARGAVGAKLPATIVNISSMSGFIVNVPQEQAAYNVSKAGVAMLTKSLAVEWLPLGIRVNSIAPGYFASDMTRSVAEADPDMAAGWVSRIPAGRMGEPAELGDLAVYLASERSRYMVGQNVLIDGGYTIV